MYNYNFTGFDYYTPPRSVRFNAEDNDTSITIRTTKDSEDNFESFVVVAKHPLVSNGTADGRIVVNIVDDDGTYVDR